jgi:hypothetical protein
MGGGAGTTGGGTGATGGGTSAMGGGAGAMGGGTSAMGGGTATLDGGTAGPLTISPNPRYFQDATGRALILVGSHTWNNLQDWGDGTLQPFDFPAYVRFLVQHNHNFTLLWRTELPTFCGLPTNASATLVASPHPWQRTGPGNATDGQPKFDLTKHDTAFFTRLRDRVSQLNDAGIWVGVYLFTGEWLDAFRCSNDGYPFSAANNINGIDDQGGDGSMSMTAPNGITAIQTAMVDKTVDTLNDLPNVLWIVSEEAGANTMWWQSYVIAHLRSYEAGKPHRHPIGLATVDGHSDSELYNFDIDWAAPVAKQSPTMSCGTGTPACKVNINDSDHSYFGMWNDSAQTNRQYAWENFVGGNQVIFMDPYTTYYPRESRNLCSLPTAAICAAPDTRWDNFRDNLGYILRYSKKLNLRAAQPSSTLSSTGWCLGQTPAIGTELLVYAPSGGTFTVDLSKALGRTMNIEWFDPATGVVVSTGTVAGGSSTQSFATPAAIQTDAVLYIVDSAGHG